MEQLKHECGVAMIRLRKPLEYYKQKYKTSTWALDKLYLLMEKQHNRGQEGAGVGVVNLDSPAGQEYLFRERAEGQNAIQEIFGAINTQIANAMNNAESEGTPFLGQINMGHLRYSTTGRSGISYVHPFLRRNNWRSRNLMLCGNFNMTNVDELFDGIVARGQHPRLKSDTIVLLEQLGYALDSENHRLYREFRDTLVDPNLTKAIEENLDMSRVLRSVSPTWDGGFVICGATGSGDMFVLRDAHGIRPAFYYYDDEVIVVASERPVIQTTFNVRRIQVNELLPGQALIVSSNGNFSIKQILDRGEETKCSFERIYFSRGSDADIYRERKQLGRHLVEPLWRMLGDEGQTDEAIVRDTVYSFIPNTAEVAFIGMEEGLAKRLDEMKVQRVSRLIAAGKTSAEDIAEALSPQLRIEKVALKDIKLRTFIAEGVSRNALAAHVYDVTYGCINNDRDTLVVIDDSIVRGTTLKQSILTMLDRLHPRRIIIVSSSPQVRYPDFYGIDMSRLSEFAAFRAAIALLKERGMENVLTETYNRCLEELAKEHSTVNAVKAIYKPFTAEEISKKIAEMLTPDDIHARVDILYQSLEGLHDAVPNNTGDWYFSGDYPTEGGVRLVNRSFVNFYEGNAMRR
jgi:amidophosphoribosyltransferase